MQKFSTQIVLIIINVGHTLGYIIIIIIIIIQALDLTVLWGFIRRSELSLFFSRIDLIFGKRINFIGNTREMKASIIVVNFLTTEGLLKLQLSL